MLILRISAESPSGRRACAGFPFRWKDQFYRLAVIDGIDDIALVATHEHWQRLGDRSANTIVIETET